jgi:hypothetical protein
VEKTVIRSDQAETWISGTIRNLKLFEAWRNKFSVGMTCPLRH